MKMKSLHLRTLVLAWSMVITACLGGHTLRAQLPEMRPEFAPKYKGEILQDGQSIAMPMLEMLQRKQDSLMNLRYRERQAFYEHRNHAELDEAKVKMRRNEIMNADKEASVGDTITWTWTVDGAEQWRYFEAYGTDMAIVDWGDGYGDTLKRSDLYGNRSMMHRYATPGIYDVLLYSKNDQPITGINVSYAYIHGNGDSLAWGNCDNRVTQLDVSKCKTLQELTCDNNALTKLDVSQNVLLVQLCCYNNMIEELDVSNNPKLSMFYCSGNPLKALDVSNNPELEYFDIQGMKFTNIDVRHNPHLRHLYATSNKFSEIDVSNNQELEFVTLADNQLSLSHLSGMIEFWEARGMNVEHRFENQHIDILLGKGDTLYGLMSEMVLNGVETTLDFNVIPLEAYRFFDDGKLVFVQPGDYHIVLTNESVRDYDQYMKGYYDTSQVQVFYYITVTDTPIDPDPIVPDIIVPENGAGWIWMANAGEEKEIEFKGTGKGFRVDWGDGSTSDGKGAAGLDKQSSATKDSEQELKHRYASEGIYTVKIEPLSSQGRLTFLDVSDERVLALSFGDVSMLEELYCPENMLVSLDLGGAEKLKEVDFSDNRLTELKLPNHQSLKEVDGEENRLRLSAIYDILSKRAAKATYEFTPQGDSVTLTAGQALDLSSEMHLGGKNTTYTLRYADGRLASQADYTESNGIFRFMEADRRYTLSLANAAVTDYENGKAMQPITFVWYIAVSGVGNEGADLSTPPVVYVKDRTIYIKDATGEAEVYSILGQLLYKGMNREIPVTSPGVYIVSVGNYRAKVLVR